MESSSLVERPLRPPKPPFSFLVDSNLGVEGLRVATQIRQSHLKRNDVVDPWTDKTLGLLESVEETMDGWIADELRKHPAFPWFSRVKGIGNENIAKVVGLIDISRAPMISSLWRYAGMHVVSVTLTPNQQFEEIEKSAAALQARLAELGKRFGRNPEREREQIQVLHSQTIGALIASLGQQLPSELPITRNQAPTRTMYKGTGTKLDYNSELRTMCFRLANSLLKAGLRTFCVKCKVRRPTKREDESTPVCEKCGSTDFESRPTSPYAEFYVNAKRDIVAKLASRGTFIVPTRELTKDGRGKIFEPIGTISADHVHKQALRKMIKLFLSHLWLVWREAVNLPITTPYAHGILGHESPIISPWDMVEKPKKTPRTRKKAA